ncbi:MAG: protein tyrosine kinase, partial [Chloroflexi bacterium]|nr:protein tyrosine kinase [Chloroflexota bacterium]
MELKQYAALFWRWAWLIILAAILAAGTAYLTSSAQTPVYQASTQILIDQAPDSRTSEYTNILTSERLARTYVELMTTRPVLKETLERVGDGIDVDTFRTMVNVSIVRDTQLMQLTVDHTDPKMTA